jgi:hypothetical protein
MFLRDQTKGDAMAAKSLMSHKRFVGSGNAPVDATKQKDGRTSSHNELVAGRIRRFGECQIAGLAA